MGQLALRIHIDYACQEWETLRSLSCQIMRALRIHMRSLVMTLLLDFIAFMAFMAFIAFMGAMIVTASLDQRYDSQFAALELETK